MKKKVSFSYGHLELDSDRKLVYSFYSKEELIELKKAVEREIMSW